MARTFCASCYYGIADIGNLFICGLNMTQRAYRIDRLARESPALIKTFQRRAAESFPLNFQINFSSSQLFYYYFHSTAFSRRNRPLFHQCDWSILLLYPPFCFCCFPFGANNIARIHILPIKLLASSVISQYRSVLWCASLGRWQNAPATPDTARQTCTIFAIDGKYANRVAQSTWTLLPGLLVFFYFDGLFIILLIHRSRSHLFRLYPCSAFSRG